MDKEQVNQDQHVDDVDQVEVDVEVDAIKDENTEENTPRDQKLNELTDRLKRTMAEFDNYRKRTDKEKSQMYDIGSKDVLEKILPIIDNFERAFSTVPEDEKDKNFAQGIGLIYKQLTAVIEELGVSVIEAVGQEFDPNLHNAVNHGEDENLGKNIVAEEYLKGYRYKDSVLRYSMVKVVN